MAGRKMGKPQQLALWFWGQFIQEDGDVFKNPKFWRYVRECKLILERGYKPELIQETLRAMQNAGKSIQTLWAIEYKDGTETWYEKCADPVRNAPPIYETVDYQRWCEEHATP